MPGKPDHDQEHHQDQDHHQDQVHQDRDGDVPADASLRLLTDPDARDMLAAMLEPAGAQLLGWSVRDVDHRPGQRATATYAVNVAWPDGVSEETLGASVTTSPEAVVGENARRFAVTDGDHHVHVWRYPFDPELPALPAVCYQDSAAEVLRRLGIDCPRPRLRVVSYRARKRAVVEVRTGASRLFVKVVRPRAMPDLRRRHVMLADAGVPVPDCIGWSDDGLMVLAELPGTTLADALDPHGADACPADELVTLLDRLPGDVRDLPRREPWAAHAAHYAAVVGSALPSIADRVNSLASDINTALNKYDEGDDGNGSDEPTHGDFYESQLTVHDGRVAGLLDIDTVGPGRRADDLGCLVAHLSVLATMTSGRAEHVRSAIETWTPTFDRRVDPPELRIRAAAVVLSLANGPFRAREPGWQRATGDRVRLAERWLESAKDGSLPFF